MDDPNSDADRTLRSLVDEIHPGSAETPSTDPAVRTETVVTDTSETLFDGQRPPFDDGLVKESLPELLTMLVGLRTSDTHGKGIIEDLDRFFGADLSPGTVYPALHELDDEGVLEMRELVQTKEYDIGDRTAACGLLEDAMAQHFALGLVFKRALEELDASDSRAAGDEIPL